MASLFQGEQRRAMIIGAGGLGLVVVLFLGSRLFAGGGDDAEAPITTPTTVPGAPTQPGTPGTGGGTGGQGGLGDGGAAPVIPIPDLPDAFEIRELRDPFTPPLEQILAEQALGGGQSGSPGGGDTADAAARIDLDRIETDGGEPVAVGEVDGSSFRAAEGETFGPGDEFSVVSLDVEDQCGLFLFGDEPFTVCVDETIPQK